MILKFSLLIVIALCIEFRFQYEGESFCVATNGAFLPSNTNGVRCGSFNLTKDLAIFTTTRNVRQFLSFVYNCKTVNRTFIKCNTVLRPKPRSMKYIRVCGDYSLCLEKKCLSHINSKYLHFGDECLKSKVLLTANIAGIQEPMLLVTTTLDLNTTQSTTIRDVSTNVTTTSTSIPQINDNKIPPSYDSGAMPV